MPQALVRVTATPTLLTSTDALGKITAQEQTGVRVRLGRGTNAVAPTQWLDVWPGEGPLGKTLDEIAPGATGNRLWGQAVNGDTTIAVSWA